MPISAYPGLNCPLYPLPLNFVYNDLEMATPYVHHVNTSFQRQLTNDFMIDVRVRRQVRLQAGGPPAFQPGAVHQLAANRAAPSAGNAPERVLYEPGIIGPTSRVLETQLSELVQRPGVEGDQAHEPRVHVLDLLHTLEGVDTLLDQGAGLTAGVANPFDPDYERPFAVRSPARRRHLVDVGAGSPSSRTASSMRCSPTGP